MSAPTDVIAPWVDAAALEALERVVEGPRAPERVGNAAASNGPDETLARQERAVLVDRRLQILERLVTHATAMVTTIAAVLRITPEEIQQARQGLVRELAALGLLDLATPSGSPRKDPNP